MMRIAVLASLVVLLIWGSACTTTERPALQPTPNVAPEVRDELQRVKNAKLGAARYELQLYQEQLEVTKKEISNLQEKAGTVSKTGTILNGPSKELLARRDNLEEKVIQAKVKLRELEILANEKD